MEWLDYLPLVMFAALLGFILLGFPVAFTLSGTALIFAGIGFYFDVFYLTDLGFIANKVFGVMGNFTLIAVPLFIFMGIVLERAGIADELLVTVSELLSEIRGSLAITVVLVGALLAASTGIVGATVVTMGLLSLPTMLEKGYKKELACGTIAASGTLGQIVPPSIVLVLLGDIMNVDVGDLFVGALIPGLLMIGCYLLYLFLVSFIDKNAVPSNTESSKKNYSFKELFNISRYQVVSATLQSKVTS